VNDVNQSHINRITDIVASRTGRPTDRIVVTYQAGSTLFTTRVEYETSTSANLGGQALAGGITVLSTDLASGLGTTVSTPLIVQTTSEEPVIAPSPPPPSPPPSPPQFFPMPGPPPPPPLIPPLFPPIVDDTNWILIAYMSLFGAAMLAASIIGVVYFVKQRSAKLLAVEA